MNPIVHAELSWLAAQGLALRRDRRLVVLAGRPGIGKTALACAILARHALAEPPVPCFFASCEQTAREVSERILALHSGRTLYQIRQNPLPLAALERLHRGGLLLSEAGAPTLAHLGAITGNAISPSFEARFTGLGEHGTPIDRFAYRLESARVTSVRLETEPDGTLTESFDVMGQRIEWTGWGSDGQPVSQSWTRDQSY